MSGRQTSVCDVFLEIFYVSILSYNSHKMLNKAAATVKGTSPIQFLQDKNACQAFYFGERHSVGA